jgi:predicted ester cyclase
MTVWALGCCWWRWGGKGRYGDALVPSWAYRTGLGSPSRYITRSSDVFAAGRQHNRPHAVTHAVTHKQEGAAVDHAATMRGTYERINAGDIAGFGDLVADDFVEHGGGGPGFPPTKEGTLEFFRSLLAAFPDMRLTVEDLIAGRDKAVARVKVTGTHKGEFMGVPPTGTRVGVELIDIQRFDNAGLVCEHWGVADMLSLMQQLGVVPADPPA